VTPPQLYCSAFPGIPHRCDGVCVRFNSVAWYFWVVWDALQVFIKFVLETGHGASCLATDIYWKAVEKLWMFNLKAQFSDCPNFTSWTLFYLGDSGTGDPALLMCMILFQHLGQFLLEYSRCIWFCIFPSSSPESTSWGLKTTCSIEE